MPDPSTTPNKPSPPHPGSNTPWSAGQTLGLGLAIAILLPLVNMVVALLMVGFASVADSSFNQQLFLRGLQHDGRYLTLAIIATNVATIWLVLQFVRLRGAVDWQTYLAVRLPPHSAWAVTAVALMLYLSASHLFGQLYQRPVFPEFLITVYQSADPLLLFWIAVAIIAPLAEELFFRGFLFVGLRNSRCGASGAIIITALLWSGTHVQYDLYEKVEIFLLGVIFGWLRHQFNSVLVPFFGHVAMNLLVLTLLAQHLS
ncbi:MAG: CPBP family intramembrane metalloprotease [Immundisolibacteraceae bacterium]|nr:CPBP family intramembrane metalloprotease [Immundisolibacteraceae bacterium]